MPRIDLDILNQKQTPAFYASSLATRPAAGFVGRIFIDSDNPSTGLYRDTGTAYVQIADPGAGTTGTLQQVTTNGSSTTIGISTNGNGIGIGTTIPASNRLDIHSASGLNATFNGTGTTNAALQLQLAGVGKWTLQNNYNSAANDFVITNVLTSENTITIDNSNNLTSIGSLQSIKGTSPTGVSQFVLKTSSGAIRGSLGLIGTDGTNTGSGTFLYNYLDNGTAVPVFQTTRGTGNIDFAFSGSFAGKLIVSSATSDNQIQIVGANAPSLRIDNLATGATKRAGLGISTTANNFIQGSVDRDFCIFNGSTTATSPILFGVYDAGTGNTQEALRISAARNLLVGTAIDGGYKLSVSGTTNITGLLTGTSANFTSNVSVGESSWLKFNNTNTIFSSGGVGFFIQQPDGSTPTTFRSSTGVTQLTIGTGTGSATFTGAIAIANTVTAAIAAPSTHKVSILIGGVQYYLLASNV